MKIRNFLENKKFYKRILLLIMLVSILLISIFSLVSYFNIQKVVLENEYEANRKVLNQIMFNINYMDETINNLIIPVFFKPQIASIMYSDEVDINDFYNEFKNIKGDLFGSNPFIHTVAVYNNKTGMFYSSDGIFNYNESDLRIVIDNISEIPVCKPILRKREMGNVISYVVYISNNETNKIGGALIIDASVDWLVKTLKSINMIDDKQNDEIFLLNDKGQYITTDSDETQLMTDLKGIYAKQMDTVKDAEKTQGFFKHKIGNTDYLITYMPVAKANWVLLKLQPYNSVLKDAMSLKYIYLILTFLFVILILIASVFVSNYIYKPFGRLVSQITSTASGLNTSSPDYIRDEIAFLNEAYAYSNEQLKKYKSQMNLDKNMRKEFFLRKIFSDSYFITIDELKKAIQEFNLKLSPEGRYVVCVLKIDNYKAFEEKFSHKDRNLYKFAMINLFTEVLSECFENEAVDLKTDHVSVLISSKEDDDYFYKLKGLLIKAQKYFSQYFNISVTATISEPENELRNITSTYENVLNNSLYRFVYGNMSIITEDMVRNNNANTSVGSSESAQKRLEDAIKLENLEIAYSAINSILTEISGFSYNNILLSVMHLINTIKTTVDEVNASRLIPVQLSFNTITCNILQTETMEEIHEKLFNLLSTLHKGNEEKESQKKTLLVDKIKKIIEEKYFETGLCLQNIAEMMNMSQKYISRTFKEQTNIFIPDYINQVRLNKALELLENSRLGVGKIALQVGMENENYFYTLFKKKYGVTPREYSLNKKVNTK